WLAVGVFSGVADAVRLSSAVIVNVLVWVPVGIRKAVPVRVDVWIGLAVRVRMDVWVTDGVFVGVAVVVTVCDG
ncbi:MAG: hypothetical protein AAGU05_06885, partial [Anaerolineaceae bacterium]